MHRRALLVAAALLGGVAVLGPTPASAAPVSAVSPVSDCTTSTGVLVVVDLRSFGGSIVRGCATAPSTGLDALHAAGFDTDGTVRDGPRFVCRIDGHPDAEQDACVVTPPATRYWSYWHADAGQSRWTYSSEGAASYAPHAGSIDTWVFGATDVGGTSGQPGFTPAQARAGSFAAGGGGSSAPRGAPDTEPRSTAAGGSAPGTGSTGSGQGIAAPRIPGTRSFPGGPAAANSSAARASGSSVASGSAPASASGSAAASSPGFVDASPRSAATSTSGGSPVPVIIGVVLVALLAAGALWRRRER